MLSKVSFLLAAVYAVTGLAQTALVTTTLRPSTTCATICVDYVNACGKTYGGCGPRCTGQPLPTFPAPPCTTTGLVTTSTYRPTTTKTSTAACTTLCIDYINTCGGMWGTCIPKCPGTPLPTFTPPPCSSRTTTPPITTPPTTTKSTTSSTTASSCPRLCVDYVNSCGSLWGTCFPRCPGQTMPSITVPDCSTRPLVTTSSVPVPPLRLWEQCGGIGFTPRGLCPADSTCAFINDYYSQCIPAK